MAIKRLDEYTNEELLELTEEQVETLIDLECAHEGVALLPVEAPIKPDDSKIGPDSVIYEIKNLEHFETMEDAQKVVEVASKLPRVQKQYLSHASYKEKKGPVDSDIGINIVKVFSEQHYANVATENARIEASLKAYKEAKEEYDELFEKHGEISESVISRLNVARNEKNMLDTLKDEAGRYISLAQGEKEIAKNFMINARPNQKDMIEEHFESWVVRLVTDRMRNVA